MLRSVCFFAAILLAGCATQPVEQPVVTGESAVSAVGDGIRLAADPGLESPALSAGLDHLGLRLADGVAELQ